MPSNEHTTCDLYDKYEDALAICASQFTSYGRRPAACGRARLVRCYADNSLPKRLLAGPGEGGMLIVDGGGSLSHALMGDMIAAGASEQGWAGVIIFGAVRDIGALAGIDLHIKALGNVPRKTQKLEQGVELEQMECGGIIWHRGDWVYSDAEGLVVSRDRLELKGH